MIAGPTAPSEGILANYLLTIIIPTIIIIFMLVMAMLLACVLYKKRMAGKVNLFYSESLPPRAPVLLKDELYDESCHYIRTNGNGAQKLGFRGLLTDKIDPLDISLGYPWRIHHNKWKLGQPIPFCCSDKSSLRCDEPQ